MTNSGLKDIKGTPIMDGTRLIMVKWDTNANGNRCILTIKWNPQQARFEARMGETVVTDMMTAARDGIVIPSGPVKSTNKKQGNCLNCGRVFDKKAAHQKYCSYKGPDNCKDAFWLKRDPSREAFRRYDGPDGFDYDDPEGWDGHKDESNRG